VVAERDISNYDCSYKIIRHRGHRLQITIHHTHYNSKESKIKMRKLKKLIKATFKDYSD
jgi:hypothetical protein